jgi:hypothetical protein
VPADRRGRGAALGRRVDNGIGSALGGAELNARRAGLRTVAPSRRLVTGPALPTNPAQPADCAPRGLTLTVTTPSCDNTWRTAGPSNIHDRRGHRGELAGAPAVSPTSTSRFRPELPPGRIGRGRYARRKPVLDARRRKSSAAVRMAHLADLGGLRIPDVSPRHGGRAATSASSVRAAAGRRPATRTARGRG